MTRIEVFLTKNEYIGFKVSGHSDYAESGSDIVCAAVSSIVSFAADLLSECEGFRFESDEKNAVVSLRVAPCSLANTVLFVFTRQVQAIASDYKKFLSVTLVDSDAIKTKGNKHND